MTTRERPSAADLELGEMRPGELDEASALLAAAYRDNALTFAMLGDDPERRLSVNEDIHRFRLRAMNPPPIVARRDARLVGVSGFDRPGGSQPSTDDQQRFLERLHAAGILQRAQELLADFDRHGTKVHHWHLGPVGVSPEVQGIGIGTLMVEQFCAHVDALGAAAALETDNENNARLYAKSGFVTYTVAEVIGVPMWFMLRPANT